MIKKIIAFGDSCTYGHGLIDCHMANGDPGTEPSELAWPRLLSKLFNCDVYNLGIPGASNKEIWNNILKIKIDQDAVVIVGWSIFDRYSVIRKHQLDQIGIWRNDKVSKNFFKYFYDDHDMLLDFYGRVNHIKLHLDQLGIKNYHFHVNAQTLKPIRWNTVSFLPIDFVELRTKFPLAEDNLHPGPQAHKAVADTLYDLIHKDL